MEIRDKFINQGYLIIENLIDKDFNSFLKDEFSNQDKIKNSKCKEGSVIFFNTKLLHRSLENKSEKIRRNLIMEWSGSNNCTITGMRWFYQGLKPEVLILIR